MVDRNDTKKKNKFWYPSREFIYHNKLLSIHIIAVILKSDSHLSKKIICFSGSPLKMMKNAFYFILKALFVLKIYKFLS